MARFWPILLFIAIFIFVWLQPEKLQSENNASEISSPQRVISLAPSITETLFALDAGDKVVAVTDYCRYPNQVKNLPKVGGYLDPNLEQIVRLKADMVILLERQQSLNTQLQQLGIKTLSIDNSSLAGIRNSIIDIGVAVNNVSLARNLVSEFDNQLESIQQKIHNQPEPTVLLAIAHSSHTHFLDKVYLAGQQDFYNDLLSFVCARPVMLACATIRQHLMGKQLDNDDATNSNSSEKTKMQRLVLDAREPHVVKYDTSKMERKKLDMHT